MKNHWMILPVVLMTVLGSYSVRADLNYEYYEGMWDFLPDFDSLTPAKTGTVTDFNINDRDQEEYFGFRFIGYIEVARDGDYIFYTNSDDGSALYIGNSLVVSNDGTHGMTERSGNINLTAGKHAITVTMFNKTGALGLEVRYEGPGIAKTLIPGGVLSLASHTASFPLPAHERKADPADVLQWQAPGLVTDPEYYVYFDTDPNLDSGPMGPRQSETEYDPYDTADMAGGTKYYWRIDVYDPNNGNPFTHTGNLWTFTVPLVPGLVAYYKGDPNDHSGNEHHGNLQGNATYVVDPLRGRVLSFDGNGYMDLVNPKTAAELGLGGNNPKSMTAWVYTRDFNDGGLFDVGAHSDGQEFSLRTLGNDHTWRIQYHSGNYDIDFVHDSLDKWVHFALVHDGAITRMYVNGTLKVQAPRVLNTAGSDTFRVGQYGGNGFNGLIDEFTLWDRALSLEEIRTIMPVGDFSANGVVDAHDLNNIPDDWLTDNTTPIMDPLTMDDFESYTPAIVPSIFSWMEYFAEDCVASSGTPRLLVGEPNIPEGNQAIELVYDYPDSCDGGDDWIMLGHFIVHTDLAQYDELRFWKRTHAENNENITWEMIMGSDYPGGFENEHMVVRIGPFSSTEDPNEWREVVVDLRNGDNNVNWESPYGSIDDVQYIHGILITAISNVGSGVAGKVTLDVDDFRLLDYTPGCSSWPATDLNRDCVVNMIDFAIFAGQWMNKGWL